MKTDHPFESLFLLLLGWLLGLLSPVISEMIRRRRRVTDITRAIISELREVKLKMFTVALILRVKLEALDDEFLGLCESELRAYGGVESADKLLGMVARLRGFPERDRAQAAAMANNPSAATRLQAQRSPVLTTLIPEMANCSLAFQGAILRIQENLDYFNDTVSYTRQLFFMTFDDRGASNREIILKNLDQAYGELAKRALTVAKMIKDVSQG